MDETGMDEPDESAGSERRWRLRAPGGRASRLELYVVAAVVLVLGFGSVGGAIVVATNDPPASKGTETAEARAEVIETTTTTTAPVVTAPPTTEAPPPPSPPPTTAPRSVGEWTETYTVPTTPPINGPSGRTCVVPDVTTLGTFAPAGGYARFSALVKDSGCRWPLEIDCVDPAVPDGTVREVGSNPPAGTVIDSNAIWYHLVHWNPALAESIRPGGVVPPAC